MESPPPTNTSPDATTAAFPPTPAGLSAPPAAPPPVPIEALAGSMALGGIDRAGAPVPCITCGTDLRGQHIFRACPTCRTPVAASYRPISDFGTLNVARPCLSCGYNLQGLPVEGGCPECGSPVLQSLRGNLLRFASVHHLKILTWGATLAFWGSLAALTLSLLSGFGGFSMRVARAGSLDVFGALVGSFSTLATLTMLAGWWLLSEPDPGVPGSAAVRRTRGLLRIGLVLSAAVTIGEIVLQLNGYSIGLFMFMSGKSSGIEVAAWFVQKAAIGLRYFPAMVYAQQLAARIPDRKLYNDAGRLLWLGPVLAIVAVCIGWIVSWIFVLVMVWDARRLLRLTRDFAQRLEAEGARSSSEPDSPQRHRDTEGTAR